MVSGCLLPTIHHCVHALWFWEACKSFEMCGFDWYDTRKPICWITLAKMVQQFHWAVTILSVAWWRTHVRNLETAWILTQYYLVFNNKSWLTSDNRTEIVEYKIGFPEIGENLNLKNLYFLWKSCISIESFQATVAYMLICSRQDYQNPPKLHVNSSCFFPTTREKVFAIACMKFPPPPPSTSLSLSLSPSPNDVEKKRTLCCCLPLSTGCLFFTEGSNPTLYGGRGWTFMHVWQDFSPCF